MRLGLTILVMALVCAIGCTSIREREPPGPVAGYGTAPKIDGVLEEGEWDDAEIVLVDTIEQFRMKHDGVHLYFGLKAGGGDVRFNTEEGLRVLHWSAQLGCAEYARTDSVTQSLVRPFSFELWGLRNESPDVIQEALSHYLHRNGWVSNTASMGNLMESELAVSLDWLGVDAKSTGLVQIPDVRIGGGLLVCRDDPRAEELRALSPDDLKRRYPSVFWPSDSMPDDQLSMGECPDTIRVDPANYGSIWVDLGDRTAPGQP